MIIVPSSSTLNYRPYEMVRPIYMIVYNVTTKVEQQIAAEWLKWMQEVHIPELIATRCFTHATILELIEVDTTDGPTYAVQLHAETKVHYNRYIEKFADDMRRESMKKWGERAISFRSVLKVVN